MKEYAIPDFDFFQLLLVAQKTLPFRERFVDKA